MSGGDLSGFSMLDLFRQEVETQASMLSDGLLSLEQNPSGTEDIESLMRAAHSIKGAARMVGVDAAAELAHVMEDYFVGVQEGKLELVGDHIDVLFRGVDMLMRISQVEESAAASWLSEHGGEIKAMVAAVVGLSTLGGAGVAADLQMPEAVVGLSTPGEGGVAADPQTSEAVVESTAAAEPLPAALDAVPVVETVETRAEVPSETATPDAAEAVAGSAVEDQDRVVRVTADNLNRLMGLAGEALVDTRWLQPFAESLLQLKSGQVELTEVVDGLRGALEGVELSEEALMRLDNTQRKVGECRQMLAARLHELEMFARRSESLSDRLYHEVIDSRMRPFADGVQGFPRMVRDLARRLEKKVVLEIEGKTTKVDRDILAKLEAPLNHLVRNSLDHGIELPEERLAAGKTAEGRVRLEAGHRAGMLSITLSDDGHGMDIERLRQKILDKELADAEMVEQMSEAELVDFLFLPGFSTSSEVTEISGRGVGLDVVQSMVQEVGGILRATSEPGKGMTFHMQLPLTLSVMRTLLVEVCGAPYAFPLARIDRALKISRSEVEVIEDRQYFRFNEQNIGLVPAHQVLEIEGADSAADEWSIVVLSDRLDRYALVVDRFLGERDLVVRPLDPRLGKTKDISAVAFMEDSSPILIIDVEDMVRSIDNLVTGGRLRKLGHALDMQQAKTRKRVLVVDDSITVREVERKLLENSGYEVEVAVDGMDGWNAVRTGTYDLVVSDVDMPRMNGIEFVHMIKQDAQLQHIPVMIVSYKDREEDRLRGLEAGANYYLTKSSFQDQTLLNAVVDLIGEA